VVRPKVHIARSVEQRAQPLGVQVTCVCAAIQMGEEGGRLEVAATASWDVLSEVAASSVD
jgi:hypothetical protein